MLLSIPSYFYTSDMFTSQEEKITYTTLCFINGLPSQELVPNMRILCIKSCIITGSFPVYPNLRKLEIREHIQFVLPEPESVPNLNILRIFNTEHVRNPQSTDYLIPSYNNLQVLYIDIISFQNISLPKTEDLLLLETFAVLDDFTYRTRNKRPIYIKTDRHRVLLLNLIEHNYIRESYIIKEIMSKNK
jgi:hypothetical protein